jgi:hypothetical protein
MDTVKWPGRSGNTYTYYVYEIGANLKAEGGNYIFAKSVSGKWSPVYIGQTKDLSERFDDHHKASCIRGERATHLHAHLNARKDDRLSEESDLIANFTTSCNG